MFFSRKRPLVELLSGSTDCHSHILPGVDDGIRTDEDALAVLAHFESLGVERVIFTPHIMEDYPENTASRLRSEFERFCSLYKGNIKLSLGAEYMLDTQFRKHLDSDDILTLWDNYMLVETSFIEASLHIKEVVREIMSKGYFVILAHPERYLYMQKQDYAELKEMGVLFQLNLPSIAGSYGKTVQKQAEMLLNLGYYNHKGSDIHSLRAFIRQTERTKINPKKLLF